MANHPIQRINTLKELYNVDYRNSKPILLSAIDTPKNYKN